MEDMCMENQSDFSQRLLCWDELAGDEQQLVQAAMAATNSSFAPYSHFRVGAAVRIASGEIVSGSNQECASYPCGICAERVALFSACHHFPGGVVSMLAVAARDESGFLPKPISPCGLCRQVISEVQLRGEADITLLLYGTEGVLRLNSAAALLPGVFSL